MIDGFVGHGCGCFVNLYHGACDGIHTVRQVLHIQAAVAAVIIAVVVIVVAVITVIITAVRTAAGRLLLQSADCLGKLFDLCIDLALGGTAVIINRLCGSDRRV